MKTVLITGASSGMGFDTARLLAKSEFKVYGAARNVDKMEPLKQYGVTPIYMDVTDEESMKDGVSEVIKDSGSIDVLVNGAGYGSFGAIENVPIDEAKRQFDVNVFGLAALTKLVVPYMKKQHSGKIINISSMAGRLSVPLGGWYFASKHTVESISDSMRMELKPFGIAVVLIEPGAIKSNWEKIAMDHLMAASKNTDYEAEAQKTKRNFDKCYASRFASSSELITKTIKKVILKKHTHPRYLIGFGAKPMVFLNAILPTRIMDKIFTKIM